MAASIKSRFMLLSFNYYKYNFYFVKYFLKNIKILEARFKITKTAISSHAVE